MPRFCHALLFSLALPLCQAWTAEAATLQPSPNHPERQWQVLESPHFLIHFYQGHARLAREVADIAEASYSQVTDDLGARPRGKVPVILTDDSFWNGYAEPLKDRIVLDPLLGRSSMMGMRRFFTHEFTHVITFEAFNSGIPISKVYGASGVPGWFMEGLAQYEAEYWYPSLDRMLRLHTLDRSLLTPSQRDNFHLGGGQAGSSGYNEGFAICKYLFETYGHDRLPRLLAALRGGRGGFGGAIETVFGKPLAELEAEWRQNIEEHYQKQIAGRSLDAPGSSAVVPFKEDQAQIKARVAPDGQVLAFMSSRGRAGYVNLRGFLMGRLPLYVSRADGEGAVKVADRVLSHAWSPDGNTLAYSYFDEDADGDPVTRIAIAPVEREAWGTPAAKLKVGKAVELETLDGVTDPTWSPDGKSLAAVQSKDERTDIVLIDLATKAISRSLTATVDDRQYGSLAWAPRGEWIAGTTYYPGTGSKLMLVSASDGSSRPLTGGNVMVSDTDPVWAPEGTQLFFSSDRQGFTDLHRMTLADGRTERLTNTYTGAEEPAVSSDGSALLFTRHHSNGSEIRRLPLQTAVPKVAAIPQGPAPAKPAIAVTQPASVQIRSYHLGLAPDLIIPLTGRDEKGDQVGIGATFNDVLEKHALSAQLYYGLASNRFSYLVAYENAMFDPMLRAVGFDIPTLAVSLDGKTPYLQRSQGGAFLAARPVLENLNVAIGLWGTYLRNVSDLAATVDPATILQGWNPHVSLNAEYGHTSGGTDADIHPTSGARLEGQWEAGLPFLGGAYTYNTFSLEGATYFAVGETGHVVALRAAGGFSLGQASPFLLGGSPITLSVGVQGLTPLRGYPIGSIVGNRLVATSAEYRMPVFKNIDWSLGSIYLDRVYGAFFADIGNAWFDGDPFIPRIGVGGELRARLGIGGRGPVGISIGVGQGLIQGTPLPSVYWYLGNVF